MTLVAGIDSSTQSCKVVIRDAESGALVRTGSAQHPDGTEIDPEHWWTALQSAIDQAGGLRDVEALSIAGQQHGMVALDEHGAVIRPALLWNDVRSADAAEELTLELGDGDRTAGARRWAHDVGLVPQASFTVTKLRWLADHEPENARRVMAIALPHDWLTWRLAGGGSGPGGNSGQLDMTDLDRLVTDRSEASGTGYFDAVSNVYRRDLLARALRCNDQRAESLVLPRVLGPHQAAGRGSTTMTAGQVVLGPGLGDNAGAALALQLRPGDTMLSLGTSGVVGTVSVNRANDPTGLVAGFADGSGRHLHLAVTFNAARILDATARVLGVDHTVLSELALQAEPGAAGLIYIPYLEGERTPNLPTATGTLLGMTQRSMTRENIARATIEGLLCHLADAMSTIAAQGVTISAVSLVGGAAQSAAVRELAPAILGVPVAVPAPGEYVANGAARQAAWVLSGSAEPPEWPQPDTLIYAAPSTPDRLAAYREGATVAGYDRENFHGSTASV
ncbi:MAG: FGGY family carbohydrate kinase [Nakamurella sp.]